jgi:hypothetical protein
MNAINKHLPDFFELVDRGNHQLSEQPERSSRDSGGELLTVCPYLRLKHDTETAAAYVRRDHACGMLRNRLISPESQQKFCLTSKYVGCPHYSPNAKPDNDVSLRERVSPYRREIVFLIIVFLLLIGAGVIIAAREAFPASGETTDPVDNGESAIVAALPTPTETTDPVPTPTPTTTAEVDILQVPEPTKEPREETLDFDNEFFEAVWSRVELPVLEGEDERAWLWGPAPLTPGIQEPYAEAPNGECIVQYFEKSRLEINDPAAEP